MAEAVGNVGYEVHILALLAAEQTVNGVDYHLDDVDVLPFIETADIVCLRYFALMENKVDGTGMVFNEQPVAHVLSLAIYGQRLTVTDIVDEQRDELFGELVRAVVV